jgi:tetratricopeptide (TPR) repeat protein
LAWSYERVIDGVVESVFDLPSPARSPVGLLDPRRAALPFRGRVDELAELVEWCESKGLTHGIVQLLSAASGHGATRLGVELVAAMRARGWVAGMLRTGPDRQDLARLAAGPDPLLVVVDDAEARAGDVAALKPLFTTARDTLIRILLIGHADDDRGLFAPLEPAFEQLGYPFCTLSRIVATNLTVDDRLRVWQEAVATLAPRLPEVATLGCVPWAVPTPVPPTIDPPTELLDRGGGVAVPEVQFAALAALLGAALGDRVTDQILVWESWYWFQQAIEHELFFPDYRACASLAAQAAIWGAGTRDDALRLVSGMLAPTVEEPATTVQVTEWLSGLYPGPGSFWRFPRTLAEHLAATDAAVEDGLLQAGAAAAGEAQRRHAAGLLLPALPGTPLLHSAVIDAAEAAPELWAPAIVHTAAAVAAPAPATSWRGSRSRRRPAAAPPPDGRVNDGILALVDALAISADQVDGDALNLLSDLDQALPFPAGPLATVALAVTQKLLDGATLINSYEHGEWEVMVAVHTGRLAMRLSDLERFDKAAEASRQAVDLLRPHAVGNHELTAELARILGYRAAELAACGQYEQAAAVANESADLRRQLTAIHPDKQLQFSLAVALIIHAEALRDLGRSTHGQPAAREALTLIEPLAREDRHVADTWLPRALDLQPPADDI